MIRPNAWLCIGAVAVACGRAPEPTPQVVTQTVGARDSADSLLQLGYMSDAPGDSIRFGLRRVPTSRLVRFLADSRRISPEPGVNGFLPADPTVFLYSVASEGGCVNDTHYVCYHDYLIAVRADWTDAVPLAYELGQIGEVVDFKWVADSAGEYRVRMTLRNWPSSVIEAKQGHVLQEESVEVAFTSDSLWLVSRTRKP